AESASITIIAKEWLKRDFGNEVNFLNGVSIHEILLNMITLPLYFITISISLDTRARWPIIF
ncbi:hypothetical protein BDR03DRAFT_860063, partial [Suillus americanus]